MSVPQWQRGANLLAVQQKAVELLAHAIRVVGQQTNFKRHHHKELGDPIVELARCLLYSVIDSQKPHSGVDPNKSLLEALKFSEYLKQEINMNLWEFDLQPNCASHWMELIDSWRESCFAQMRANEKSSK